MSFSTASFYRGRLAPTPSGLLHAGHARTFYTAWQRAREAAGTLVMRMDDLDADRCRPEYAEAALHDLRWLGLEWQEGPDCGGPFAPYCQSERMKHYVSAFEQLRAGDFVYPCRCSRKELSALHAPHEGEEEPVYPGICLRSPPAPFERVQWRFRTTPGEAVEFTDLHFGPQRFVAGSDFGDFVVWRTCGMPSYQLAVVADDADMGITEVVRGADLLLSTARQLLLYRALSLPVPQFYHCDLVRGENGVRLAKRCNALSLRSLREQGCQPHQLTALQGG